MIIKKKLKVVSVKLRKYLRSILIEKFGLKLGLVNDSQPTGTIENVTIVGSGVFLTNRTGVVLDFFKHKSWAFVDLKIRYFVKYFFVKLKILSVENVENVLYLHHPYSGNYFHFLIEQLAYYQSFVNYPQSAKIFFATPNELLPWQKRYLELLDIDTNRFLKVNTAYKVDSLQYLAAMINFSYSKNNLLALSKKVVSKVILSKNQYEQNGPNYLYISRKDAKRRNILNEEDLTRQIRKYNFEIVELTKLTVDEQVLLFSNAKVIIAPHGAGNSNIIYSKNVSLFVELRLKNSQQGDAYYEELSQLLDINYLPFYSADYDKNENMIIDVPAVLDAVKPFV